MHLGMWGGNPEDEFSDWDVYYRGVITIDLSTDGINNLVLPVVGKDQ